MASFQGQNLTSYSPYTRAACATTVRSPIGLHGMDHPMWLEQYRDPALTDAVYLNALNGMACDRVANSPTRDDQYFSVVVEQRPVFQLPPEVTRQSDNVPTVFESQVKNSCGFDIGNDQIYVSSDYVLYCSDKNPNA